MADADYDGLGGGVSQGGGTVGQGSARAERYLRLAGALSSVALVAGFGIWGYKLAVRDVLGVPVIQALDGPMRIAPADPGGEIADHQGLAVNDVAAVGIATPLPERLALAPRPQELAEEDLPGLTGLVPPAMPAVAPGEVQPGGADLALAAAPQTESASPTELAVDAAIAEALGLTPDDVGVAEDLASAGEMAASDALEGPVLEDLAAEPAPEGAITLSPRPRSRPSASEVAASRSTIAPQDLEGLSEVDPTTIPVGARLVQFGAFNTADEARAEWVRLQSSFGELMTEKGLVLQPAESGGRTFFRLRATGFDDEDDARRFCAAFVAQSVTCIPVPQR
jgi:SPOR domain